MDKIYDSIKNSAVSAYKYIKGKIKQGVLNIDPAYGLSKEQIQKVNKLLGNRSGLSPSEQRSTLLDAIAEVKNNQ